MKNKEIIKKAWKVAIAFSKHHNHDIGHIKRVTALATEIQKQEGGNLFAIQLSAILHDIGRIVESITGEDHAKVSANITLRLMQLWEVEDSTQKIVYDAIYNHRYSKNRIPKTLEGKILSDADKLDALGAIGIARVFKHNPNRTIYEDIKHFYEKILQLPSSMYTHTGYQLAQERIKVVKCFLEYWHKEVAIEEKYQLYT